MKRYTFLIFTAIISLALFAACSNSGDENSPSDTADQETITIEHELDNEPVEVPLNPERVVVFDFSVLDTISFIGKEDRVVGFPKETIPRYLNEYNSDEYENFGTLKEPDFEKIHASQPDLIIIANRQADLYDQFKEIAPTILIDIDMNNYLSSFEDNAKTIGKLFDKEELVKEELDNINEQIDHIKDTVTELDQSALIILGTEGKISAFGPASRFGIIHDVFGIKPADDQIEESTHGQSITFEYILDTDPDVIYIIDRDQAIGMESSVQESFENDIIKKTNAYTNNNIIYLNGEVWYLASGGLQSIYIMINEIIETMP